MFNIKSDFMVEPEKLSMLKAKKESIGKILKISLLEHMIYQSLDMLLLILLVYVFGNHYPPMSLILIILTQVIISKPSKLNKELNISPVYSIQMIQLNKEKNYV